MSAMRRSNSRSVQSPGSEETISSNEAARPTTQSLLAVLGDPHPLDQLAAQRVRLPFDLDRDRPVERLAGANVDADARLDAALAQVAQHRGVAVGDTDEGGGAPRLDLGERHGL